MVEFRLLGSVSLTSGEGRDATSLLGQPRRLALLAYLAAATPRGIQRRDQLLTLFWPELDQGHARAALRQALHVLREELGPHVLVCRGDEEVGLDFDVVRCDVAEFDCAVVAGRLTEALDLYRGELLEGFFISEAPEFERWQDDERRRLREMASRAAQALVEGAENGGDLPTAAIWARRALRLAPHDEGQLRRLLTLLDLLGDRGGSPPTSKHSPPLRPRRSSPRSARGRRPRHRSHRAPMRPPSPRANATPSAAPASGPPCWRASSQLQPATGRWCAWRVSRGLARRRLSRAASRNSPPAAARPRSLAGAAPSGSRARKPTSRCSKRFRACSTAPRMKR